MKKRILFVDDEKNVLRGLERSLRGQRRVWEMVFVESSEAALQQLDEKHFDAIVTDMRMPGMGGAQLLDVMTKDHPELIRIILSGHSAEEIIIRSVCSAHQFLTKPCDINQLKEALIRSFELKAFLSDTRLQALVTGLARLPSLPRTYQEIITKLDSQNVSSKEIGKVIATDPAMTAKILQLVNSAFYGIGQHVSDSAKAVTIIGLESLKALTLSFGIFAQFDQKLANSSGFSIESLWQHSLSVARMAKRIAQHEGVDKTTVDDCFLAGMLHDIGILILVQNFSEDYAQVRRLVMDQGIEQVHAEQEMFSTTHGAVGAFLLGIWGLADSVVEAVAFHHHPGAAKSRVFCPLLAVYAADILTCRETHSEGLQVNQIRAVDPEFFKHAGLTGRIDEWAQLELEDNEHAYA